MSFATINSFRCVTRKLGLCLWHLNSLTTPRKWTPSYVRVTFYKRLQSSNIRVRVTRSLVLYVCFVDRCLSFCTFFSFLPLCCLSFLDIRILITSLSYLQTLLLLLSFFFWPLCCLFCLDIRILITLILIRGGLCRYDGMVLVQLLYNIYI